MWSQFKDESSDYRTGAEWLVPSTMCNTSIFGLFMDIWRLWEQWWLNSLQQLYSPSTCWAGLPCTVYIATACTKCKCCFSASPAPEYLILDLSNHLAAVKPSSKTVCFWRKMWYLMYYMEKPTLYGVLNLVLEDEFWKSLDFVLWIQILISSWSNVTPSKQSYASDDYSETTFKN